MLMTTKCICKNWILKTLDPEKAITLFDGVNSSCNCIRELIILVLTMSLPITFFLRSVCFSIHRLNFKKKNNFNMIILRFIMSC